MFFNKYIENTNLPTVANRFADIVVQFETSRNIFHEETEDCDIDDEFTEEQQLYCIDENETNFNFK